MIQCRKVDTKTMFEKKTGANPNEFAANFWNCDSKSVHSGDQKKWGFLREQNDFLQTVIFLTHQEPCNLALLRQLRHRHLLQQYEHIAPP